MGTVNVLCLLWDPTRSSITTECKVPNAAPDPDMNLHRTAAYFKIKKNFPPVEMKGLLSFHLTTVFLN